MTLYEMLDATKYYQKVWIFETNVFDQNMPVFKGSVNDARKNTDHVWDYLPCKVNNYDCTSGILVIFVRNEYYEEHLEGHYSASSAKWGKNREERPWLYSYEIYSDLEDRINGRGR